MNGNPVRTAMTRDIPKLSDILARAFFTDPVLNWAMRDDERRMSALISMFRHDLEADLKYGEATTTADLMACAIWVPPEARNESHTLLEDLLMIPRFIEYSGFRRARRIINFFNACEEKRPKNSHFYLESIGVHPEKQGQGYATILLRHTLAHLDAKHRPAYLESSNIQNNPLYKRHGFEIIDELHLKDGPTLWCMWRDPN
jgi:ribosomal protein S18 acetylase RimI-like enzyme